MKKGVGINTVIFLSCVLATLFAWIGFEIYHKKNDEDISPKLQQEASTILPSSFDSETLKKLYQGKDKLYKHDENSNE